MTRDDVSIDGKKIEREVREQQRKEREIYNQMDANIEQEGGIKVFVISIPLSEANDLSHLLQLARITLEVETKHTTNGATISPHISLVPSNLHPSSKDMADIVVACLDSDLISPSYLNVFDDSGSAYNFYNYGADNPDIPNSVDEHRDIDLRE